MPQKEGLQPLFSLLLEASPLAPDNTVLESSVGKFLGGSCEAPHRHVSFHSQLDRINSIVVYFSKSKKGFYEYIQNPRQKWIVPHS